MTKKNNNLLYWHNRVMNAALDLKPFWETILVESNRNDLNPNLLLGVLAIEKANRGWLYNLIEHFLVWLLPGFVLRRDFSIGLAQIKPKTLQRELGVAPSPETLKKLMNPSEVIAIGARLLSMYCEKVGFDSRQINSDDFDENLLSVVKRYTTGSFTSFGSPWINYYFQILKGICSRRVLN